MFHSVNKLVTLQLTLFMPTPIVYRSIHIATAGCLNEMETAVQPAQGLCALPLPILPQHAAFRYAQ